ncbi:MAG: putative selenate ABC transporter substrate-binding protein [Planctomycetes bacterium]|jgi:phosphonate transport system substrate-binding protein|nr:putative selenate ABC transporter substrate-binding protein [Planctomycetota bacterium]
MRSLAALALAVLATSACSSGAAAGPKTLRFSAIPDQNSTELEEKFGRVGAYLGEQLGVSFQYVPSTDYGASVEAFKNGDIQLAWFGGLSGVRARAAVPGAQAIAQGAIDPTFKSYIVAHTSLGLQFSLSFPHELQGKTFTFGSRGSTSGRLMPEHFIRVETGRSPQDFFGSEMSFSGSHDKTAKLVEAGTFQAGALNYKVYDSMVAEGKLDPAKCVKIWETPTYPDYNWTAHPDLEERFGSGFIEDLRAAIIGMKDRELLAAAQREAGFIRASNDNFAPLAELARGLNLLR